MIKLGNFFFQYRNALFIVLYLLLFVPSPYLFSPQYFGDKFYLLQLIGGLTITLIGQLIRGATIGLAYIVRGGNHGKIHAEGLVTTGIFNHCRNPLYIGNILMLLGVGVLANSLVYVSIVMPFFLLIYQAIVLAEERYLLNKFATDFRNYCMRVHRWIPRLSNLSTTFKSMEFKWRRWLIKEYNTQFVWLSGITLVILFRYPMVQNYTLQGRITLFLSIETGLLLYYLFVRVMKKSGRWHD